MTMTVAGDANEWFEAKEQLLLLWVNISSKRRCGLVKKTSGIALQRDLLAPTKTFGTWADS